MPNNQRTKVRKILQRAGVGRTAFYAHFRGKEDVLHSTYEGIFAGHKEQLRQDTRAKPRLFPVREFFEHLAGAKPVMVAFRKAGLVDDMRSQFIGYWADIIECRIRDLNLSTTVQPRLAARMLAGSRIHDLVDCGARRWVIRAAMRVCFVSAERREKRQVNAYRAGANKQVYTRFPLWKSIVALLCAPHLSLHLFAPCMEPPPPEISARGAEPSRTSTTIATTI